MPAPRKTKTRVLYGFPAPPFSDGVFVNGELARMFRMRCIKRGNER